MNATPKLNEAASGGSSPVTCSAVVLTSEPQHDGGFMPVLTVDHQSFGFCGPVDTLEESEWFCRQMRLALQRTATKERLPWWRKDALGWPIETFAGKPVKSALRIIYQNVRKVICKQNADMEAPPRKTPNQEQG